MDSSRSADDCASYGRGASCGPLFVPIVFSVSFLLSIEKGPLKWDTLAYHRRDSDLRDSRVLTESPEGH